MRLGRCCHVADKSSIYEDPSAEASRLITTNNVTYGFSEHPSYLISANQTWGNLRRTACTRPTPSPAFYPPARDATAEQVEAASYTWKWPERPERAAAPQIARCELLSNAATSRTPRRLLQWLDLTRCLLWYVSPCSCRPEKVTQTFLQEYELRPPWLKY